MSEFTRALLSETQVERIICRLRAITDKESRDLADELERMATSSPEAKYFQERAEAYARDGEIEFDQPAPVSLGDDHGAYVAGWIWVEDERPEPEDEEDDEEIEHPEDDGDLT